MEFKSWSAQKKTSRTNRSKRRTTRFNRQRYTFTYSATQMVIASPRVGVEWRDVLVVYKYCMRGAPKAGAEYTRS